MPCGAPYLVRTKPGQKEAVAAAIEKKLLASNNGRNVRTRTITDIKRQFQGQSTMLVTVLTVLIVLLVFVTSLGIVGLTVFSVTERTRQIGTRRALGAQRVDILRYFLLENWIVTTIGLAVGDRCSRTGLNVFLVSKVSGAKMDPMLVLGRHHAALAGGSRRDFRTRAARGRASPRPSRPGTSETGAAGNLRTPRA